MAPRRGRGGAAYNPSVMNSPQLPAFALAKISQPRPNVPLLARPALERRVQAALGRRRAILLSAPAGFGKTCLLTRVFAEPAPGRALAWLAADADDDLPGLLQALVAALDPLDLPWRMAPEALLRLAAGGGAGVARSADAVLDALGGADGAAVAQGIIVIEDLHRLRDEAVYPWLDRVIERLPAAWSIVITTRVDPPLVLPRLRLQGDVCEIRAEELRFSEDETTALARLCTPAHGSDGADGGSLDAAGLRALWLRTLGWPAGLRLALQAADSSAVAERHTFDYLASEVLEHMPDELQRFLLRCSLLPELSPAQCAAVSGDGKAAQRLDEIERRELFVTALAGAERTLRLHDLFREFLEHRLQALHGDEVPALLRRAAASETDPVRRVGWLLRAGDGAAAQQALGEAAPALLLAGNESQLLRLMDAFPAEVRAASPVLAFVRGIMAWPRFKWVTMGNAMRQAAAGFDALGLAERAQQARIFLSLAAIAVGRLDDVAELLARIRAQAMTPETRAMSALLAYWLDGLCGPAEAPARRLDEMLDLLVELPSPQLWYRCAPHYIFLGRPGMAAAMERFARHAAELAGEEHLQLAMASRIQMLWVLFWRGRIDEAEATVRVLLADERWLGQSVPTRISILAFDCILQLLRGSAEGCRAAGGALVAQVDADEERKHTGRSLYVFQAGRIAAAVGDWDTVRRRLAELAVEPTDWEWPFMRIGRPCLAAALALHEGDCPRVVALLEPLLGTSAAVDIYSCDTMLRVHLAAARLRLGEVDAAWTACAPLFATARASGEIVGLLMVGSERLAELAAADWGPRLDAEGRQWLAGLLAKSHELRRAAPATVEREELTPREREVLARIAAGDSNKLIARAFDLSPHTVKRHVANILTKLDLASRGQAAAWWHEHGNR